MGVIDACSPTEEGRYVEWVVDRELPATFDKPRFLRADAAVSVSAAEKMTEDLRDVSARRPRIFTPLRRRVVDGYRQVSTDLRSVHEAHQEQLRFMTVQVNGGVHKYPVEYGNRGGHGDDHGVGTLAHSAYHYVDLVAWYLASASHRGRRVAVRLTDLHDGRRLRRDRDLRIAGESER